MGSVKGDAIEWWNSLPTDESDRRYEEFLKSRCTFLEPTLDDLVELYIEEHKEKKDDLPQM